MKAELIACFQDTLGVSENKLRDNTMFSANSNKVYKEKYVANRHKDKTASISVYSGTSFDVARKFLEYGKIAVLNFANPENPGGGVCNGAMAQEECLCRSSNLYACINNENIFEEYYGYHRRLKNYFFSDRLIYTKDIIVFKDDNAIPKMLPENEWFHVDVITCAAPYIGKRKYTNQKALKELFKGRIKNIFEAAIDNEVDVLVLGAFGCGAFKNPPDIVASAFYEVIIENDYDKEFKHIVFAIKSSNDDNPFAPCPNILAFENQFLWSRLDDRLDVNIMSEEFGKLRWTDNYPLAQAVGTVELPNGRILKGGDEFNPYFEWREKNKYYGKQFSILGDSISTLDGYNPRGYKVFYYGDNCAKARIDDFKDTWWGKVIDFFGGELLVNNSWSGSRVTKLSNSDELFPSGCSDERTALLHINSVKPDVIIIYLGTNDWAFGSRTGLGTRLLDDVDSELFEEAYSIMLKKIKANYPDSEVWCCTLSETFISGKPDFKFPHKYAGIHIEDFNEIIRNIANVSRCKLIDLYNMNKPYDSIDGSHPNRQGMQTIAESVCYVMSDEEGKLILTGDKENLQNQIEIYLSYGDFPIHNILISGNKVTYRNKIHGSRDGGLKYAGHFFDEKEIILDSEQSNRLNKIIGQMEFEEIEQENSIVRPGERPRDKYLYRKYGESWLNIRNPKLLIELCEELCDFIPYEWDNKAICIHDLNNVALDNQESEYVFIDPNITTILYDGEIHLTDAISGKEIKIKEAQFDFGRDSRCRLKLDEPKISRMHASFFYEKNNWFIKDNNSTNGTRLNGVVIEPGKKYQLLADDIIEFANCYKYIFYKTKNNSGLNLKEEIEETTEKNLVGSVIGGKYSLQEVIGSGGFTKVYLATDATHKKYAVKSVYKFNSVNKALIGSIIGEAELLQRFSHPHIRRVIEQIEDEKHIFLVLEYIDGTNLENVLSEAGGVLSEEKVIFYALQIAEALQYLHSLNPPIINRDIKPRNIMVDGFDNVKLVDFDIAMEYNPNIDDICILGTKGYAPPEQYIGKTIPKSDIYALGMVMHQLLTGVNPVEMQYEVKAIRQYNPSFSKGLEQIVEKCIKPNPDERYSSCSELINSLNKLNAKTGKKGILEKLGLR